MTRANDMQARLQDLHNGFHVDSGFPGATLAIPLPDDNVAAERFLGPLCLVATAPSEQRNPAGLTVGYTAPDNPLGIPHRTMVANDRLLWDPATVGTGGGLVSTSHDLALWRPALFSGTTMPARYVDRLLGGTGIAPYVSGILYRARVTIYSDIPRGPVFGHGGRIPGNVSSLRHFADHGVTVMCRMNTDVGIVDDRPDLVPAQEAALAGCVATASGIRDAVWRTAPAHFPSACKGEITMTDSIPVAHANRTGSTTDLADAIARHLRKAGVAVVARFVKPPVDDRRILDRIAVWAGSLAPQRRLKRA